MVDSPKIIPDENRTETSNTEHTLNELNAIGAPEDPPDLSLNHSMFQEETNNNNSAHNWEINASTADRIAMDALLKVHSHERQRLRLHLHLRQIATCL